MTNEKIEDVKKYAEDKGIIKKNTTKSEPKEIKPMFDADELILSKNYVIGVLKLVEKRWRETNTDYKFIVGLKAFRTALRWTPDKIFQTFWKQILEFLNMLMFENGKAKAKSNGESWANVLELIPTKIEKGNFDLDKDVTLGDEQN